MLNDTSILFQEEFQSARRERRVMVFPSLWKDVPDWRSAYHVIDTQNEQISEFDPDKDSRPRMFVALAAQEIPEVGRIEEDIRRACPDSTSVTSHLYYGTEKSASLGVHTDYVEVLFWQIQGNVTWRVPLNDTNVSPEDPLISCRVIDLSPGDAIYVPPAFPHEVMSHQERVSISYGMDHPSFFNLMPLHLKQRIMRRRARRNVEEMQKLRDATQKKMKEI